jgi:hypothetical protein
MTGMAAMCFGASAGFTMPSMSPMAVKKSAMVASNPVRTAYTCIKFDPLMVLCSSLPRYAL